MSCVLIDARELTKFCDEMYFLTDRTYWIEDVKILYYLIQHAYNVRYRERNEIETFTWTIRDKIHYIESREEKQNRMLYFLNSILYQINESHMLYKRGCEIVGELSMIINLNTKNHPNNWWNY